jgi:hypothetical protein
LRRGGLVLNKTAAVLAATAFLSTFALAGEPGGFRTGLYLGEVGGALAASTPVLGASLIILIPALGAT